MFQVVASSVVKSINHQQLEITPQDKSILQEKKNLCNIQTVAKASLRTCASRQSQNYHKK